MHEITCLFRDTDGLCRRVDGLLVDVRDGSLYEAELEMLPKAGLMTVDGETDVMGWGALDGRAAVYAREGVGSYLIPLATVEKLAA